MTPLLADEIAAYRRDGYIVVRGLLGARLVEACRQALSDLAADRLERRETKIWLGCTTLQGDGGDASYVYRGPLPRPVAPIDELA